jgi:hypothetical protein
MKTPTHVFTKTDSAANEWAIDDDVVRLREWGTDKSHVLPLPPTNECTVGAAAVCAIRLEDPSHLVSRLHARLIRGETGWLLRDEGSKNGVRIDGARRSEIALAPGIEIGIGRTTLIAESARSIELRNYLARLIGWGGSQIEIVDRALRSVRMAAARRVALVLCGDGELVPTAYSIHRRARGSHRPFIVCDPRRLPRKANVRSAQSYTTGLEALPVAAGGSLCVRTGRLPPDFGELVEALRAPDARIQLIVCGDELHDCERYCVIPIAIPSLASRGGDLDRIIKEYADDAMAELGTSGSEFPAIDHAWVREHAATLPEIEKATARLVALRASPSLSNAASRLGMAPVSLYRWIGRRSMPMQIKQ